MVSPPYNQQPVNKFIRLEENGNIDNTCLNNIGTGANGTINVIQLQQDGKILLGGTFNSFNGFAANNIIRLNVNCSIDSNFNLGTGFNSSVNDIFVMLDENILVGGDFTSFNGNPVKGLVKLIP
jgi:hypothetical protein